MRTHNARKGKGRHLLVLWIAAGHTMLGLSMATGTGRLVSELVTDQP